MITANRNNLAPALFNSTPPVGAAEPSPGRSLPANTNAMGRDEFLKMLVAQLKNQDPLNPMDGKDMAAQLAQFSTVEQLIQMNKTLEAQANNNNGLIDAIGRLEETQNARADELAQLIEGQMAMATVGKVGVTLGNHSFVDRDGKGTIVVDTAARSGAGRITLTNEQGEVIGTREVGPVKPGQQSFELGDVFTDPPLPAGRYSYRFEVATDGGPWQAAKTFTAGRITGMRYENGNPILIIGDRLHVPMSQLTQIRG
jgi:flagellar basal-body rod modification protein FlgD